MNEGKPTTPHQPSSQPTPSGAADAFPHGTPSATASDPTNLPPSEAEPAETSRSDGVKDAKDTASAMFDEMKAAVGGASKREPYPWLALVSMIAAVVWLLWPEDDKLGAENLKLWTVFVVASVVLVFAPMVRKVLRLSDERAWQFCVAGASGFGFAWVAFLLPTINSNQAFFGTIGLAAAGLAAWTAPGRPE
jgi:dolichyl-phosphate-mannose--protein O-mannosyl transferase